VTAKTLRQWAGLAPVSQVDADTTVLVLIDIQMDYFTPGKLLIPGGEAAVSQAAALREWARANDIAIIHIQQLSKNSSPLFASGSVGAEFHPKVMPEGNETIIQKGLPSSFRGTVLQEYLTERGIDTLVIAGLMTHMCVDSTTRDALHLGYKVIVVSDACATRDLPLANGEGILPHGELHRATLAALADRFADVLPATSVMGLATRSKI